MALVVITGGARSGKSSAAQRLAERRLADGHPVLVAVFASDSDEEMSERIERHRADRPAGFEVLEADGTASWLARVPADATLVVDCLGTWLGRALLDAWEETADGTQDLADAVELPAGCAASFTRRVRTITDAIASRSGDTIVVSNEVGSGVVPTHASGRLFRDELGRANSLLVGVADAAYLCVAGRLFDLKRLPRDAAWPHD